MRRLWPVLPSLALRFRRSHVALDGGMGSGAVDFLPGWEKLASAAATVGNCPTCRGMAAAGSGTTAETGKVAFGLRQAEGRYAPVSEGLPQDGHQRADHLPLAGRVWWPQGRPSPPSQGIGNRRTAGSSGRWPNSPWTSRFSRTSCEESPGACSAAALGGAPAGGLRRQLSAGRPKCRTCPGDATAVVSLRDMYPPSVA